MGGRYNTIVPLLALFVLFFSSGVLAGVGCGDTNNTCVVSGTISSDTNFIDANTYLLSALVTVSGSGVDLNIFPGATIKGMKAGTIAAGVRVTNGARIIAEGNSTHPITFTSCRDQTVGSNTSAVTGCSGTPGSQDYNVAISIAPDAGMTTSDSFSFLNVRHATNGIVLNQPILSIHDSNFSRFDRNVYTAAAISISGTYSDTNIYHNTIDVNWWGTAGGGYGIYSTTTSDQNFWMHGNIIDHNTVAGGFYSMYLNGNYSGEIFNNDVNLWVNGYFLYMAAGSLSGRFYDNDVNLFNARGLYVTTTTAADINVYNNRFDFNGLNGSTSYDMILFGGSFSGEFHDNNVSALLGGYMIRTVYAGDFSAPIYDNNLWLHRTFALYHGSSGEVSGRINANHVDYNGASGSNMFAFNFLGGPVSSEIFDNNFTLFLAGYAIGFTAGDFTGSIHDNNFGMEQASWGIAYTAPATFFGDINQNVFYAINAISYQGGFLLNNASG